MMEKFDCGLATLKSILNKSTVSKALSLGLLVGLAGIPAAMAEKALGSAEEPLEIKLNQTLDTDRSHHGDPFEGQLTEDHRLGQRVLPAGTLLKGKVEGGHPSMILGMPGYVSLDIQEAVLPTGEVYQFVNNGQGLQTKKYHHPKAHTGKGVLLGGIPFTVISAVDAIPLKFAAGMNFWQITPISLAARMATGVAWEMSGKNKNSPANGYPAQTRVGYGMLRGTGLTGAYHMVTTSPEPNLKEGAIISLRLPQKDMDKLFEAGGTVKTVQSVPSGQPANAVSRSADQGGLQPVEMETQGFESVSAKIPASTETPSIQPVSVESAAP